MAIIKHKTSKNANYSDVLEYYTYQHTEDPDTGHYEPILNEYGSKQERENYSIAYINAHGSEEDPELWAAACIRTNLAHGKNKAYADVKNHEYIISHPAEDRPSMTMEDLLNEGKAFARENLKGYDALIAVHRDTDNDHIHITINSVRELAREKQSWMQKNEDGQVKNAKWPLAESIRITVPLSGAPKTGCWNIPGSMALPWRTITPKRIKTGLQGSPSRYMSMERS